MSLKEQQPPQEYSVRAGLEMFNGQVVHRTNLDGTERSNDQASNGKDSTSSNNVSPIKTTPVASNSPSSSRAKLVGSNRFVIFRYLLFIFSSFIIHN
jgi:hypothetical protein